MSSPLALVPGVALCVLAGCRWQATVVKGGRRGAGAAAGREEGGGVECHRATLQPVLTLVQMLFELNGELLEWI